MSTCRERFSDWRLDNADVKLDRIILEDENPSSAIETQIDGNVYFDGSNLPDITVFGDLYVNMRRNMNVGKFNVKGTLHFILDQDVVTNFYGAGFEEFFTKYHPGQLPSCVKVHGSEK